MTGADEDIDCAECGKRFCTNPYNSIDTCKWCRNTITVRIYKRLIAVLQEQ